MLSLSPEKTKFHQSAFAVSQQNQHAPFAIVNYFIAKLSENHTNK